MTLHWSNMFGVVAVAGILVLFITGALLMVFYEPSSRPTTYSGPYVPLIGAEVSQAFASVMRVSFQVPGGLLLRQLHHWSALLVPAALMLQMLVTFFTGAFRRPRRGSWIALFLLLIVVLAGGWSGYALPDDLLSGSGLRIVHGIVLGIPFVGTWFSSLLFGGSFPGSVIENLHAIHIAVVPPLVLVLLAVRARAALRNGQPQFAAGGRSERIATGMPTFPHATVRAAGLLAVVVGLLVGVAATVQIAPIWIYGPSDPASATAASQPDWYIGFLDGALRLVPLGWEVELYGSTWTLAVLAPLLVVGSYLLVVALFPFLEEWLAKDRRDHHILDRPRNASVRTGIGVAGITFYAVLWVAASADVISLVFSVTFESVITTLQVALIAGPPLAFVITRRVCHDLQMKDRDLVAHGFETGRIVRRPGGEYVEVHQRLGEAELWRLSAHTHSQPVDEPTDEPVRSSLVERARAAAAAWFFDVRINFGGSPVGTSALPGTPPSKPSKERSHENGPGIDESADSASADESADVGTRRE